MIFVGLLVIVALVVATLWAAHSCLFGLHLNLEVKPFEVITLGVNICIAFLLQYYLANKTKDLRSEKDSCSAISLTSSPRSAAAAIHSTSVRISANTQGEASGGNRLDEAAL